MPDEETIHAMVKLLVPSYPTCKIEIGASAVTGSPYPYLYMFFTDEEAEGPHIIVSEQAEFEPEEKGWYVGYHEEYEKEGQVATVKSPAEAIAAVVEAERTFT